MNNVLKYRLQHPIRRDLGLVCDLHYGFVIEVTYQAQITPSWMLQPVFQYIVHPGGHIPNPLDTGGAQAIPNAAVFGLRTTVKY